MKALEQRKDSQIMGLELFALALGLSSFSQLLLGRTVFLWSDNVGAERGTATGRARCEHFFLFFCVCFVFPL